MNLKAFLKENVEVIDNVEYVASSRIKDENGKPVAWKMRTLSNKEVNLWKKDFIKITIEDGGVRTKDFDNDEFVKKCLVESITYPDLNNKELQDSYGVMSAEELLTEMLNPGEYVRLNEKLNEINGFTVTLADKVAKAKN